MVSNIYETDELVHQYLLFHYGPEDVQLPWKDGPKSALGFPQRCVSEGVDLERLPEEATALDLGCAVGRSTFELARHCPDVTGIDYSDSFIFAARILCRERHFPIRVTETGKIERTVDVQIPDVDCSRVRFFQGDAQDLDARLEGHDVILACNLLCRLGQPDKLLQRLPSLVKPGGQLFITTPNTWLDEFTARDYWLGATPETGEPLEALEAKLSDSFELETAWDMPFLIREHLRKYQWSMAQASRWIRK